MTTPTLDKNFYLRMLDAIPLPVYLFQDGDLIFFNQAFIDLSGYGRNEIPTIDFLDFVHSDHRETLLNQTRAALSRNMKNLPQESKLRIVRKDGETKWVKVLPRLVEHNALPAVLGVVIEITEDTPTV